MEGLSIGEVAQQVGLRPSTLRYYERIGLLPPVNRSDGGIREYNDLDVRRVEFIKCMRSAGLPIEVLIKYVGLVQEGDLTIETRKNILIEQRAQLAAKIAAIQKTQDLLDYKIDVYEKALLKRENELVLAEN